MTRHRATAHDLYALDEYNDGIKRARRAYANLTRTHQTVTCACGERTESATGLCARCRKEKP